MEGGTTAVVPAQRLAEPLAGERRRNDESLATVADRSGGRFDEAALARIEAGEVALDDGTVRDVVALYRLDPGSFAPERSALVVDLDHRQLRAGEHREPLGAPTADEVLATYLSLVYTMRHAEPGTPVSLRDADVSVLSRALELAAVDVERRLHDLMVDDADLVVERHRWLRRRVLVPAAGVLLAVTAVGALVLVDRPPPEAGPDGTTSNPVAVADPAPPAPEGAGPGAAATPDVSLIPPVVMERNPDGSPGPQVTVVGPEIGDAIVVERGPDGRPGPTVVRR